MPRDRHDSPVVVREFGDVEDGLDVGRHASDGCGLRP
jgi:hypothetical protein